MNDAGQNRRVSARCMAGTAAPIPPEMKADYLRKLIDAGFTHIDAVSFVSPAAVPQMADSEQVLGSACAAGRCRDHRHRGEREGRGACHRDWDACGRWDFPIPSRRSFCAAISTRRRRNRWKYLRPSLVMRGRRGTECGRLCFHGLWKPLRTNHGAVDEVHDRPATIAH